MSGKLYKLTPRAVEMIKPRKVKHNVDIDIMLKNDLLDWIKKHPVYLCDAKNNDECEKTGCYLNGGPCRCTTDPKYGLKRVDAMEDFEE